jgi:thiol:disulfide interchange protein
LILNIMPCVLPVLAIKILSLVQQAGQSRGRMIALNLAYSAGVISVFLVLAALAVFLALGWGAQFQSAAFTVAMTIVIFAMALSLLGVYELPIPGLIPSAHHHTEGLAGAFNTGIIATLLATPCTGPFMVNVFAFALKQPAPVVFLVFGVMGLGMASPYLISGFFPAIVNWLPKPGMWMVRFKQLSGFVLLGTVIWLLTTIDLEDRVPVLIMLLAVGFALWMVSAFHDALSSPLIRWRHRLIAVAVSAPVFLFGVQLMRETPEVGRNVAAINDVVAPQEGEVRPDHMPWSPFSEARMIELRKEGRPMLIDFTADWCGICKWNEKWAINTESVVSFIREHEVVPLMADYTKQNDEIRKWLNHFKQDSVPLTIIVPGHGGQIVALRGQYSQKELLTQLQAAISSQPAEKETAAASSLPSNAPSLGLAR